MGRRRTIFARYVIPTLLLLAKPIALIGSAVTSLSLSPPLVLPFFCHLDSVLFLDEIGFDFFHSFPEMETHFVYVLSPIFCC